jgi:hypothetical protein
MRRQQTSSSQRGVKGSNWSASPSNYDVQRLTRASEALNLKCVIRIRGFVKTVRAMKLAGA